MTAALALLASPAGRIVAVALLAGAALLWVYHEGKVSGRAGCEARVAAAVAAELQRQAAAGNAALDAARRREEAAQLDMHSLQQKVAAYEADLAGRGDPQCTLSADDVERLR